MDPTSNHFEKSFWERCAFSDYTFLNPALLHFVSSTQIDYDIVVLATGSAPFVPPVPGIDKKGVFVYRTIEDLE